MSARLLQIVKTPFGKPELCEENLKCVLDRVHKIEEDCGFHKNTIPIRIISIVGKFRTGKSFLIAALNELLKDPNFFENPENIIGGEDPDVPFKSGHQRHTTGINLFDEPFLIEDVDGQKMIVLLVDTQGAFDTRSDMNVSVKIISISNQIASTQIFNIKDYISGQDLDSLQLFVRFSTLQDEKMGQKLVFLIRDFVTDLEKYGQNKDYLSEVISETDNSKELSNAVNDIYNAYNIVDCWTLPQPSPKLIRASNQVTVAELGDDFKLHLQNFLKDEIAEHVPKKISGIPLTANGVENLIKNVVQFSNNGSIQEMRSAVQILIERSYQEAERKGIDTLFKLQGESGMLVDPFDSNGFEEFRLNAHLKSLEAYESVTCFGTTSEKLEKKKTFGDRLVDHLKTMEHENDDRFFYNHTRDLLDKLKSDYKKKMKISGVLRGTTDFEDLHQRTLDIVMVEFDEGAAKLAKVARLGSAVTAKRMQLENNIESIFRELKEDNNYLIVKEKCKRTIANVQEAYRSKMSKMLNKKPDSDVIFKTFEQARAEAKDRFWGDMASGLDIPEMSQIEEVLDAEFRPILAHEEDMALNNICGYLKQRDTESKWTLKDLQDKINQQVNPACSIM